MEEIQKERREGKPICASRGHNPGYYIPRNKKEMADYCKILESNGREIYKTRKACLETIKDLKD